MALKRVDEITRSVIDETRRKQEHPEDFRPIKTNLEDLDKIIGGITEDDYVVIGGKFKTGKTALALHIATAIATSKRGRVDYYCLEERQAQIGIRSLVRLTEKTDKTTMRQLLLQEEHFNELEIAQKMLADGKVDLWLEDVEFTVEKIIETTIKNKARFLVIDYLQLLQSSRRGKDDYTRWDAISAQFLRARNEHSLCSIVVYQIGKSGEAYATSAIYRDADIIIEIERKKDIVTEKDLEEFIHVNVRRSRVCAGDECDISFSGAHSRVGNVPALDTLTL